MEAILENDKGEDGEAQCAESLQKKRVERECAPLVASNQRKFSCNKYH